MFVLFYIIPRTSITPSRAGAQIIDWTKCYNCTIWGFKSTSSGIKFNVIFHLYRLDRVTVPASLSRSEDLMRKYTHSPEQGAGHIGSVQKMFSVKIILTIPPLAMNLSICHQKKRFLQKPSEDRLKKKTLWCNHVHFISTVWSITSDAPLQISFFPPQLAGWPFSPVVSHLILLISGWIQLAVEKACRKVWRIVTLDSFSLVSMSTV